MASSLPVGVGSGGGGHENWYVRWQCCLIQPSVCDAERERERERERNRIHGKFQGFEPKTS